MNRSIGPHLWQIRAFQDIIIFLIAALAFYLVDYFWQSFMPVFVASMLAYIFNPALRFAQRKWNLPRSLSAIIIIAVTYLLLAGIIVFIWPIAEDQLKILGKNLPDYIQTFAERNNIRIPELTGDLGIWVQRLENPEGIVQEILSRSGRAFNLINQFIGTAAYLLLLSFIIPLFFFFFSLHFDEVLQWLIQLIPISERERTLEILGKMDEAVANFFQGRLLVSMICIVLYSVGWLLADVPYWFLIGVMAGALNIIPFASGILWPAAVLVKYIDSVRQGDGADLISIIVWPTAAFLVVQFFEGWVLTPWVQSDQLELSVPTVIIVVMIGGECAGFIGLLLAVPVTACIKIFFTEVIIKRMTRFAERN